jgi:hypothetical protein
MPIRTEIWTVGARPEALRGAALAKEQLLEEMIVTEPRILSDEWMLIGQQEDTGYGGRIDLLAVAPDGSLVLVELKRGRTPREVVAQALDYGTWVERLRADDIAAIYGRFAPGRSLADDFRQRFGRPLDEDELNQSHQLIIVASALDDSTERILGYLGQREIPINVLCFQVFEHGGEQLLCRSWLLDPARTQISAATAPKADHEPWNGEFYCSFGAGEARSWEEADRHRFVSAGGGAWYSRTLQLLGPGDRVWVKVPGAGFVGVGRVTGRPTAAVDFELATPDGHRPALDVLRGGHYHRHFANDPERSEYFVPVRWLDTVPLEQAVQEIGFFGNQNTVCKPTAPRWRTTVEALKRRFSGWDDGGAAAGGRA